MKLKNGSWFRPIRPSDPATELIRELRDAARLSLAGQQGFIIEPNALLARADAYLREHGAEQAGKEDEA